MHSSDSPYQTGWCHWRDTSSYSELLSDIGILTSLRDLISLTDRVKLFDVIEETHPVTLSYSVILVFWLHGGTSLLWQTVSNSVMSLRRHIQWPWSSLETLSREREQEEVEMEEWRVAPEPEPHTDRVVFSCRKIEVGGGLKLCE